MNLRLRMTRLLILPVIALAIFTHHVYPEGSFWDTFLGMTGFILLLAAMGGRIWASVYLTGRKNETLVTEGPYSMVRNPLYLFSFIGFVGAGFAFGSVAIATLFAVVFFLTHWPTIGTEEERLEGIFGDLYARYKAKVPRFIPSARMSIETGDTVRLDAYLFSRALRDCLAIPLVFVVAEILEWAKLEGVVPVLLELP